MDQSILYVDIENLQDIARQALTTAIKDWPEDFPRPKTIKLYVKADLTDLWKTWAIHSFPNVEITVKGVQHYTYNGSKNSADLSLALDGLADVLKERAKHIAIMSDDSDYVSLFTAIKQEIVASVNPKILFKWFMTDRPNTHSQVLSEFFPAEYIHIVNCSSASEITESRTQKEIPDKEPNNISLPEEELIAIAIIQNIPVGAFKSADCKKIVKQKFPKHALNKADSPAFGTHLANNIWPFMEKYGVKSEKLARRPRKYEMTDEAKKAVG